MSQTEFTTFEKFLINREVPLLFKCNLLLLRQVPSMSLLCIKIIPSPLHKFSSFLLVLLILPSKSWSLSINNTRQCNFNVIIGVVLYDGGNYFPFFLKSIYIILDIICFSMNNYQIRFFANSWLDIINELICCCSRMNSHFN